MQINSNNKTVTVSICDTKYMSILPPVFIISKQSILINETTDHDNYGTHYMDYLEVLEHSHRFSHTNESNRFTGYQIHINLHYWGTTSRFLLLHLSNLLEASST